MIEDIVIVGAGGFGREVEWLIHRINNVEKRFNILGYVDDNKDVNEDLLNLKLLSDIDGIKNLKDNINVVVAIGNSQARKNVINRIKKIKKVKFPNLIDPLAIISEDSIKGEGNIICAGAIATVNIELNSFNIINLNCTIGHDVRISNFVTIYPNANISGGVIVNECVEIGTGTQIIQYKEIGVNSIIGAGSCVIRDIDSDVTAVGVPTRILENKG